MRRALRTRIESMKPFASLALKGTRHAIDQVDDAMVALLAGRRALVGAAAQLKRSAELPLRDTQREQRVHRRAQRVGAVLGVPPECTSRLMILLIAEAHRQQRSADTVAASSPLSFPGTGYRMSSSTAAPSDAYRHLLRLIPPPHRWRPLLAALPKTMQASALERLLSRALADPLKKHVLEPIQGRRLGIEVNDLGLYWVLELRDGRLQVSRDPAEATVCGSATDLMLLAGRLEDADTLFFQRKLMLTGDTELGLTVRNLLDRMPWETVPLGLRIVLQRGGRLARAARASYHGNA